MDLASCIAPGAARVADAAVTPCSLVSANDTEGARCERYEEDG